MGRIRQGNGYRIPTTVTQVNVDGTTSLVDPTTIAGTLQFPDLTTAGFTPTRDSLGQYHSDVAPATLAQLGLYRWKVITTGPGSGVQVGSFQVVDPFAPSHVSFEDAKARLNVSSLKDDEIEDMIASAVSAQEQRVGAVAPRTVTATVTASGGRLELPVRPVLTVTSATLSAVAVDVTGWTVPLPMAGLVQSTLWLSGTYVVTYAAGRSPVPQDLVEAALLRVQHQYETQRGAADIAFTDQVDTGVGGSFVLMLRAQDLERPYVLPAVA